MQTLPTASPEEQAIVLKAAEDRYKELGVPVETAAVLFQNEITKSAQAMLGAMEKKGQMVQPLVQGASTAGGTIKDFWDALPPMMRQGLVNALIGGGIGAAGGAGYGALQGEDIGGSAARGAGYGALAGGLTPLLSNLLQKFSADLDGTFEQLTKSAKDALVEVGFPAGDAEQILLMKLQKVAASLGAYTSKMDNKKPNAVPAPKPAPTPKPGRAKGPNETPVKKPEIMPKKKDGKGEPPSFGLKYSCDADKGDYHANTAGEYPLQVFADIKKSVKKTQKQRKIKKIASELTQAVKDAMCGTGHGDSKTKNPKAKAKKKEEKK
jgi:hypothetical protein